MFGKAKCKLCGDNVRFAIRHLKEKQTSRCIGRQRRNEIEYVKNNGKNFSNSAVTLGELVSLKNHNILSIVAHYQLMAACSFDNLNIAALI
jgi:hypothetical protein